MRYSFIRSAQLCEICAKEGLSVSEVMLRREMERSERSMDDIMADLRSNLQVMQTSITKGLDPENLQHGVFTGGDAVKLNHFAASSNMGREMAEIVAAAIAVVEVNASMGKIVAAPTAGASGILPVVLLMCGRTRNFDEEMLCRGLLTAGAIGCLIASNASIAGASGGCQAETGSAAAMAAGALTELCGGTPEMVFHAAAMALKNVMGLVCDPVGGLVECPCVKRNAIGAANAVVSCDMALAGITSLIPFDEVVDAMKAVGNQMHPDLRETARGGLAATPTGKALAEKLHQ